MHVEKEVVVAKTNEINNFSFGLKDLALKTHKGTNYEVKRFMFLGETRNKKVNEEKVRKLPIGKQLHDHFLWRRSDHAF